jgi:hypothetical protein
MMVIEPEMQRIYSLIAGRLLWEPDFIHSLMKNPKKALKDTLEDAGISPSDDVMKQLLADFDKVKVKSNDGYGLILSLSTDYMANGPENMDMV